MGDDERRPGEGDGSPDRPDGPGTPRAGGAGGDPEGTADGADRSRPLAEASLEALVREQLRRLGEDPGREGLSDTPGRVAEALEFLTRGYGTTVEEAVGGGIFEEPHDSMVLVKDVELYSLCEHHMLPFFGKAHVAYIPDGKLVGLSKVPRVVDVFARRLQIQERLTEQIAGALEDAVNPRGVGVVVEAYHLCMMMRGVEKQNSKTITSAVRGTFREDPRTREEFLRLVLSPQFVS